MQIESLFPPLSADRLPLCPFSTEKILDYIPRMACKWMAIGIKFKEQDLVRSLQNSSVDDEGKLTQIFMKWEESGSASWQLLIETLDSKGVKLGTVAKEILQGEEYWLWCLFNGPSFLINLACNLCCTLT